MFLYFCEFSILYSDYYFELVVFGRYMLLLSILKLVLVCTTQSNMMQDENLIALIVFFTLVGTALYFHHNIKVLWLNLKIPYSRKKRLS